MSELVASDTIHMMMPPGRRKQTIPSWVCLFAALFVFLHSAHAASAVLGIDLGTEYIKAAIARPGSPIEIVLTKDSKRKEAAAVAFKPSRAQINDPLAYPERLYGGDALALSTRYNGDVYTNLKPLLGLSVHSDIVKAYASRFPGLNVESTPRNQGGPGDGTVSLRSSHFSDSKEQFMLEELLAMELKNIRANAETLAGGQSVVTDAVITYPAFWTVEEKRALELAADLAGLRVLALISDGLAVGLNYATTRTFESITDGAKPEHHLIYDIGAGSTTASILKFQGRTIKDYGKKNKTIQEVQVLATAADRSLGGDTFNDVIVDDMVKKFVQKDKMKAFGMEPIHIKRHAKTISRFWKEAERMRQVLSANSVTSATLEGVYYDDMVFKYKLEREQFEALLSDYANRISNPISEALNSAGLTLGDLDSVILHGGMIRTPFIQKQLEAAIGDPTKMKTNVNADEAAVMGAAFKAASLSLSFRVKDIRSSDIGGEPYTLKWTSDGKEKQQKLFTASSLTGLDKQVPMNLLQDTSFEFLRSSHKDEPVLSIEASNLTKSVEELHSKGCASVNITTSFTMRLSAIDGLPQISSGSVSCKADVLKDGGVLGNVKGLFGFGRKDSTQQVLNNEDEDEPDNGTPLPVSDPTSSGTTISQASETQNADVNSTGSASPSKSIKAAKPKPTVLSIPLLLKPTPLGLNTPPGAEMPRLRERLSQFDSSDRNAVLRSEALNNLEGFTYRARDYLSDKSFLASANDKVQTEIETALSAASEWLYGDGVDAKLQDFKDKLKGLKAIIDPVLKRKDESTGRDKAIESLRGSMDSMKSMIEMVQGGIAQAAEAASSSIKSAASSVAKPLTSSTTSAPPSGEDDLEDDPYASSSGELVAEEADLPLPKPYEYTTEDLSSLTKMYDTVTNWLEEKLAAQKKLTAYEDPAMLVSDLEARGRQLQSAISDVIMKSIKMQDLPKKPKKASTKKPKPSKSKKGKTSVTASDNGTASTSTETMNSAKATTSKKDEL